MMNLLSQQRKESVRNEYRLRLIAVGLFALFITIIIAGVLLVPAYITNSVQLDNIRGQINSFEGKRAEDITFLRDTIQKTNELIHILTEDNINVLVYADVIQPITEKKGNVDITTISYNTGVNEAVVVQISGVAPSRDMLLSFADKLKQHPSFSNIEVPVSHLASRTNVEFSLEITVKK